VGAVSDRGRSVGVEEGVLEGIGEGVQVGVKEGMAVGAGVQVSGRPTVTRGVTEEDGACTGLQDASISIKKRLSSRAFRIPDSLPDGQVLPPMVNKNSPGDKSPGQETGFQIC
jgi:hypothetical protein